MTFEVGDRVRYFSVKGRHDYSEHTVTDVYPNGIPSYPKPMVKLTDRSGAIAASHCELIERARPQKGAP